MQKAFWLILLTVLGPCAGAGHAQPPAFEYPSAVLDAYEADGTCWMGMDAAGAYPARVVPTPWLVGPPPSQSSAVTVPADCWIDLAFSGRLVPGDGNDVEVVETGKSGEQALLFVTDGADQEYLLTRLTVENSARQDLTYFRIGLGGVALPFVPRAVRVVGLDLGGQAPGFDLSHVRARVSHEGGARACYPNPVSGATNVNPCVKLTWSPGKTARGHRVHLGPSLPQLESESPDDSPYPPQPRDANTFEPSALGLGRTYYWRIDEVGDSGSDTPTLGDVWSFTVADRLVVEDFEAYDLKEHFLYEAWQTRGRADLSLEQEVAWGCGQSLLFFYQYDSVWPSEVVHSFDPPQDWARPQARVLQFMVRGAPGNATKGQMYVTLGDGQTEQRVAYQGDLHVLAEPQWHVCRLALPEFNQINLAHVTSIALGLRPAPTDPQGQGRGTIYLDDIVLRPAVCLENRDAPDSVEGRSPADLTADGTVDYRDLQRLAQDWLRDGPGVLAVATPNEPILRYEFEGDANDEGGQADGELHGRCNFVPGVYGQAIQFGKDGDTVTVRQAPRIFEQIRKAITITFWQRGTDSAHRNTTVCCSNYVYGQTDPALAVYLGCWRDPGRYGWECGSPWSFANRLAGRHGAKSEWSGRWNHWAFTKDSRTGRMEIYRNGELYDSRTGASTPLTGITSFTIGTGWYGRYDGALDDFRIYDYALSAAEIAHVATHGTGVLPQPPEAPADLNADGTVDFRDLALLASRWLQTNLWP